MSHFLKMGATFASFQSFGTWPVCNDLLNIISSIGEISWLNSFRTVGAGVYAESRRGVLRTGDCVPGRALLA